MFRMTGGSEFRTEVRTINSNSKCQEMHDEAVDTKEVSQNKNYKEKLGSIRRAKNSNVSNHTRATVSK